MDFMEKKYGTQATNGRPGELEALKIEAKDLQDKVDAKKEDEDSDASERTLGSHEETDPDEEDDYLDDLPEAQPAAKQRGPRASVSAEAFGSWNQRKAFEPKVHEKSEESKVAIREKLNMCFMFSALDENEKDIVIAAMEEKITETKEHVINEGDEGDCLYVVGSGTLLC